MMKRYFFTAYVRVQGSLGVFDPAGLSVDFDEEAATFPAKPTDAAIEKAHALGWETCGLTLIRTENV